MPCSDFQTYGTHLEDLLVWLHIMVDGSKWHAVNDLRVSQVRLNF